MIEFKPKFKPSNIISLNRIINFKKINLKKFIFWAFILLFVIVILRFPNSTRLHEGIMLFALISLGVSYIETNILYKKTLKNYMQREEILYNLTRLGSDFIAYKDTNFNFIMTNDTYKSYIKKIGKDTLKELTDYDVCTKPEADIVRKYDTQAINTKKSVQYMLECEVPFEDEYTSRIFDCATHPVFEDGQIVGTVSIARDVTEKEHAKRNHIKKHNLLLGTINNLPLIACLRNTKGEIIFGNKEQYNALKVDYDPVTGEYCEVDARRKYKKFLEDLPGLLMEDKAIIEKGTRLCCERIMNFAGDNPQWYRVYKSPIYDDKNEVIGVVSCAENIEVERTAREERETFVATLSHDLKTPTLAQIKSLELLAQNNFGKLNKEQKEIVNLTLNSCRYMLDMISMILYTYKCRDGKMELNVEEFNLIELTKDICKELQHLSQEKNINIIINTQLERGDIVADKLQLKRVIVNMLINSIIYAHSDTEVDISINQIEGPVIEFLIKNKSPYIPEAVMKNIFNKYVTENYKHNKVGMGLGLYISKKIIETHLGEIISESSRKNENVFGFRLNTNFLGKEYSEFLNKSNGIYRSTV